ncbi:MAG TPA: hypothetical protein EYP35_02485 [Desulfobacterales bacterium]|nr:hypothetical protein [Desulfobacterales bacterium]
MKRLKIKLIIFSFFTILLPPSITLAEQADELSFEGILQDIRYIHEKQLQIKLDKNWYSLEGNSILFMCDQRLKEKELDDLNEFLNYRINLIQSAEGRFNKIYILCE